MAQSQPTLVGSVNADRVVVASHVGTIVMAAEARAPVLRANPVRALPRAYPPLLNRTNETRRAVDALGNVVSVQFFGEPGVGKSMLLRHLAHHPVRDVFPDGAVYLPPGRVPLPDLLQAFYDVFYDRDPAYKPTDAQIAQTLQDKQALVCVDDVGLSRDDSQRLLDSAPRCAFVLCSAERVLWGEGTAVGLRGLPLDETLALIEREVGQSLSEDERGAAQAVWQMLHGHPFKILQVAAAAVQDGLGLIQVAAHLGAQTADVKPGLVALAVAGLSDAERTVLGVVAGLGGAGLGVEHVQRLSGVAAASQILERLEGRHLVESHSPRYSLCSPWVGDLDAELDLEGWRGRALAYFAAFAEAQPLQSTALEPDLDAMLRLHAWAVDTRRWSEALRLGRGVDAALMLAGRWGAWATLLDSCLAAARALGDVAGEAWALHQLGSRALCRHENETARRLLQEALRLREGLGDVEGAEVTRHNLGLLPPPPDGGEPRPRPGLPPRRPLVAALVAVLLVLCGGGALAFGQLSAGGGVAMMLRLADFGPPSVSGTPTPGASGSPPSPGVAQAGLATSPVATGSPTGRTMTATSTPTVAPPTATETLAPPPTATPTELPTATETATPTPPAPTATELPAATETATPAPPTATERATPTETATPLPPTDTPVPLPRTTPSATPAPVDAPVVDPVVAQSVSEVADLRFGIDEGIRNDAVLAETGATWERVVLPWSGAQPDGPTQPPRLTVPNAPLDAAVRRGVRVAGLLEFTPAWARENPAAGEASPPRNLDLPFDDPNNYWGRFVFQTVRAYAGRIDEWIVWNEPDFRPGDAGVLASSAGWLGSDEQFAQLLKVAYQAAHAANPNATVVFAGTTYWNDELARRPQFYERVLQILQRDPASRRANAFHDAVAVNLYRSPDDVYRIHTVFTAIQQRHGIEKPVWLTETNAMPTDDPEIACPHADADVKTTLEQQSAFVVQAFALASAAGYQRVSFFQMLDQNPCQQAAVFGATRDDGTRRPVLDALHTVMRAFAGTVRAEFVPLPRVIESWPSWPHDSGAYVSNWRVYEVALSLPGNRRLTVLWNAEGSPMAVSVKQHGTSATAIGKYGATLPVGVEPGGWVLNLAPATASDARDPAGYFFIGGDPVILVEEGVPAGAAVEPPVVGGAAGASFDIAANPADQTVDSGRAAEFFLATQGANGTPIQIRLTEWSTQADPSSHDPASLPLGINLPLIIRAGQTATVHIETAGAQPGIYFLTLSASAGAVSHTVELALVVK